MFSYLLQVLQVGGQVLFSYLLQVLQVGEGLGGQQVLVGHEVNPLVLRQQGDGGYGVVAVLAHVALPTAMQLHVAQEMGAFAAGVGTLLTAVLLEPRDFQQCIHLVKQVRGNSINRSLIRHK